MGRHQTWDLAYIVTELRDDLRGRRKLTIAIGTSLAVLAAMTVLVAFRATIALDLAVTRALQSVASPPLDVLANLNTVVGQAAVTTAIAALLAYIAWRRGPRRGWLAASLFIVVGVVGVVLKLVLVHPPPPDAYVRAFWNPLGVDITTPSGFPSGHIARVTFLVVFAGAMVRSAAARVGLAAVVTYTFWARIYIGDHWLSDVVGGLALGVAAGCVAAAWLRRCRARDLGRS